MNKKILSLGLATVLTIGTVACAAEPKEVDVKNENVEVVDEKNANDKEVINVEDTENDKQNETESDYVKYVGTIKEVNNEDGVLGVTVDTADQSATHKTIKFNVSPQTLLLSDKTQDFVDQSNVKEGMKVEALYSKDAPMTKSLPPMTNAKAIILREAEETNALGVKLDTFNKDLISKDNMLKLNITEDTVIVDKSGKELTKEDMIDKEVVVFYGPAETMSIPGQSNAVKIIVLEGGNAEIEALDKIIYEGKEINLTKHIYKTEDNMTMIPLRQVGEGLGYEVSWNAQTRQAELKKDSNYLTATEDQDMYGFSKMIVKLGKAAEIKDGHMYVPAKFITDVMKLNMEVDKNGVLVIK